MERHLTTKAQQSPVRVNHLQPQSARSSSGAHPFLELQRSIGNQAVQRLIRSSHIQTKLQISTPGDPFEQEADRVADTVMRMTEPEAMDEEEAVDVQKKSVATQITPLVQRETEETQEEEQEEMIAPKSMVQRAALAVREDDDEDKLGSQFNQSITAQKHPDEINLAEDISVQRQANEEETEEVETQEEELDEEEVSGLEPVQRKIHQVAHERLWMRQLSPSAPNPFPPSLGMHHVQRLCTECEEEAEEQSVVQEKADSFGHAGTPDRPESNVEQSLSAAKASSAALDDSVRAPMERALGADLSSVRIHTDSRADSLSTSLHAHAFTTGSDIFFRQSRFDPSSHEGKRLLAHELTHVVQQNPHIKLSNAATSKEVSRNPSPLTSRYLSTASSGNSKAIQRDADVPKSAKTCGKIRMLDEQGKDVFSQDKPAIFYAPGSPCPGPGAHPFEIIQTRTGFAEKVYTEGCTKTETYPLVKYPSDIRDLMKKVKSFLVVVPDPNDPNKQTFEVCPGAKQKEGKEGEAKEAEGGETKGKEGMEGQEAEEGEVEGGGKKGGSKYGVFGLLDAPRWVTKALEKTLDFLGKEEEMKALTDLLRALKDLHTHLDEFKELFADTDKLLEVALGIKESKALDQLETWVSTPSTKHGVTAKKKTTKGIAGLAKRLLGVLTKIKNVLRPIFKVRGAAKNAIGLAAATVVDLAAFEEIFERRAELKSKPDALDPLLEGLAADLSTSIEGKIEGLRTSFKMKRESFGEEDFVQSEELARAVTEAVLMMLKGPAKLVARAIQKVGGGRVEQAIADKFIAPLLPKAALDAINDQLRSLTKLLDEKFISALEGDVNNILTEFQFSLEQHLIPEIKNAVISLSPKAGSGKALSTTNTFREIKNSRGEALPHDVKEEMESETGFDFGDVQIYRDSAAQKASESLNANAFTLGSRVFFGPGQYDPNSNAGRRLIAHELTHVAQQRQGITTGIIQRDYKTTLNKLVKKFGSAITSSIVAVGRPSAKKKDQADKILTRVNKLIGKQVYSATNPVLPAEAYVYTRLDKRNKPRGIRRKTKWLGLLPALSIAKSKIQYGLLSRLDPKAKDRAALRAALSCDSKKKKEEAHHIIPLERVSHPVVKLAVRNGFGINTKKNGICLLPTTHSGSHGTYTTKVTQMLDALRTQNPGLVWSNSFAATFDAELLKIRNKLIKLNNAKQSIQSML